MKLPRRPERSVTEKLVKAEIRAAVSAVAGVLCFPNAVGEYDKTDDFTGRTYHIVYGLARGSSDLILSVRGIFTAIECKKAQPAWLNPKSKAKPTAHEQEQIEFIRLVEESGGIGGFAWDIPSAQAIVSRALAKLP